jgi:hypothetical protein
MNRRQFLSGGGLAAAAAISSAGCLAGPSSPDKEYFVNWARGILNISWPLSGEDLRLRVIGDTHFTYFDSRDKEYADNYARMSGFGKNLPEEHLPGEAGQEFFEQAISSAAKDNIDAIILVGDILSFPSIANVEYAKKSLDACGVPWMYIAGNHDWHFEGLEGSSDALRKTWVAKRLSPLYPEGANPMMYSKVVKGVRIVAIDNSTYLISREQVDFWKAEASKGDPIILAMHIPLYVEACGSQYYCGSPKWGAATDGIWEIERRPRWAEKATDETFEFRDAVLSTPNLVGVFTGHIHHAISMRGNGQNMFSVADCRAKRRHLDVTVQKATR